MGRQRELNGSNISDTWSGKTPIPIDCDKLDMYIVILRATPKKAIQSDILKNTKNEEIIQKCPCNSKEGNEREMEEQETE